MSTHTSCLGSRSQANHLSTARPVVGSTNSRPFLRACGLPQSSVSALTASGHRGKHCSGVLGVQQAGSSSSRLGAADKIACRATSVLAGPAAGADRASAEAVGEALLKRWLGVAEKDSLPIFKVGAVPGSAESAIHFLQARRRSRALACINRPAIV
jgi:hypothetical protein